MHSNPSLNKDIMIEKTVLFAAVNPAKIKEIMIRKPYYTSFQ